MSAASGGNSEPKQGQRSQSARGFCPRSTMRVPQPDIIEHFGNADAVPQLPERCLSRKAGFVRCCLRMKEQHAARFGISSVRMVLLALGIDRLGASAIVSVPCTVSQGTGRDFANLTLIVYHIPVAAQFVIKGPGG